VFSNVSYFFPSLIFQGKSRGNPSELSLERGSIQVSSSIACKCLSRVETTNYCKHSSLLWYGKSYCRKKFYSTESLESIFLPNSIITFKNFSAIMFGGKVTKTSQHIHNLKLNQGILTEGKAQYSWPPY